MRRLGLPLEPRAGAPLAGGGGWHLRRCRSGPCSTGVAANLAGGTHHAFPDHGEGYCVFNDIAVSIRTPPGPGQHRAGAGGGHRRAPGQRNRGRLRRGSSGVHLQHPRGAATSPSASSAPRWTWASPTERVTRSTSACCVRHLSSRPRGGPAGPGLLPGGSGSAGQRHAGATRAVARRAVRPATPSSSRRPAAPGSPEVPHRSAAATPAPSRRRSRRTSAPIGPSARSAGKLAGPPSDGSARPRRLATLYDESPEPIFVFAPRWRDQRVVDFHYRYVNPAAARILGRAPGDKLGQSLRTTAPTPSARGCSPATCGRWRPASPPTP
mgnify:CR=1 FL=1